jgi:hypothetical protein
VAHTGMAMRDLRAFRYDPPGYAKQGARRTTFQSALEQCEQFLAAAREAGYATRPVQLFYALSQAGRAIVAASPRIGNQDWRVNGHGLTANTNAQTAADVTVTATKTGMFPTVAAALGLEPLVADEPAALRDLWPLLPESALVPLTPDSLLPVLLFLHPGQPDGPISQAQITRIPHRVRDLYGDDPAQVKTHLDHYPALRDSTLRVSAPNLQVKWGDANPLLYLLVEWRDRLELSDEAPPVMIAAKKTANDLGLASCKSADDLVITPAIGSMSTGLHPTLALWVVLLALSSLARYEPATWSKMIDIDRSAEASAIEHLLDEATDSVPAVTRHLLTTFQ